MSFSKLVANEFGQIVLVNLYETATGGLLTDVSLKTALSSLFRELGSLGGHPAENEIVRAFRTALFVTAPRFQVQARQRPRRSISVTAVVAFDVVRQILEKILQRTGKHRSKIDAIVDPDAPDQTVAKAAELINATAPRLPDITLSDWGTIFWGAPSTETDLYLGGVPAAPGSADAAARARQLRDALGLVHIDPASDDPNRHIFVFRGKRSLAQLARDFGVAFTVARPTTLDGWDNRRFCQPVFLRPTFPGCGHTIDLARRRFGPGLSELVATPLPIMHFECQYVGALDGSDFGSDAAYLRTLLRSGNLASMAAELDRMATA